MRLSTRWIFLPAAPVMAGNLQQCYETLIEKSWVGEDQLQLLEAWLAGLRMIGRNSGAIGSSFHRNAFLGRVRIRMAWFRLLRLTRRQPQP